jgi:hypothetical protein
MEEREERMRRKREKKAEEEKKAAKKKKAEEDAAGLGIIEAIEESDQSEVDSPISKMPPLGQPSDQQDEQAEDDFEYELEQEDDDDEDNDEGDDSGNKSRKRSKNYSSEEDFLLTKAWCAVSADSRNGVNQKTEVFKQKFKDAMHALVRKHNKGLSKTDPSAIKILRNKKSIMYRWSNHIKPKCSKWASVCKLVKRKSGEDEDVLTEKRQEMYRHCHGKGKNFPFLECFGLLEDLPKWAEKDENKDKAGTRKRKKKKKEKDERTIGKRQKALNEKILKINKQIGNEGGATFTNTVTGTATTNAIAMFAQQLSGMATQFSLNDWSQENREQYFRNQAQLQMLEQEKRIKLLRKELEELDKPKPDDEGEEELDEEPYPPSDEDNEDSIDDE